MMLSKTAKALIPLGGAIIFAGAAGYIFYQLYKTDDEDDDIGERNDGKNSFLMLSLVKEEVSIPISTIGVVIGRYGCNIKKIENKTCTVIKFLDGNNGEKTCIIKGKIEKVQEAKQWILRIIKEIPVIETENIYVPRNCIGLIIGRSGENINYITRTSRAKVNIPDEKNEAGTLSANDGRLICIKGSKQEIESAKQLIEEKVKECIDTKRQIKNSASNISHRNILKNGSSFWEIDNNNHKAVDNPIPSSIACRENGTIEAYVSAVNSAIHFWIQVSDFNTIAFDELIQEMTTYYQDDSNREIHTKVKILPGDIVAALFESDNKWYRGRICEHNEPEHLHEFLVHFVDFGDNDYLRPENIFTLRTDFLKLKFQAIECLLADSDLENGTTTTKEIGDCYLSRILKRGKPITMKIVSFNQNKIPLVNIGENTEDEDGDSVVVEDDQSSSESETDLQVSSESLLQVDGLNE